MGGQQHVLLLGRCGGQAARVYSSVLLVRLHSLLVPIVGKCGIEGLFWQSLVAA